MLLHSLETQAVASLITYFWKVKKRCVVENDWLPTSTQWPQSSCLSRISNKPLLRPDDPKREAHLPWQIKVTGQTVVQNSSLEPVLALRLARWHFSRCPVTTRVVRVKASRSDHLSAVGEYAKVNPRRHWYTSGSVPWRRHLATPSASRGLHSRSRGGCFGRMKGGAEDLWL